MPTETASERPTWSVVIPAHNCSQFVATALTGVLAQLAGRDDAEVVVLDDHSTDDLAAVVERVGGDRVRLERNPQRLGAIGTFNRCLTLARGDLVHLLHGDDAVRPGFYAAMEKALAAEPAAVAAVCRVRHVDEQGRTTYVTRSYRRGTGVWTDALDAFAVSNRVRAPGIVVRRAAYRQVGGYRADLPHAADWEMWTRLAAHGKIVFVDRVLADYRRHQASDTTTRVRTADNIKERLTAIGVVAAHVPPERRRWTTRRALAATAVFGIRTSIALVRAGDRWGAMRQAREVARCAVLLPRGTAGVTALLRPADERRLPRSPGPHEEALRLTTRP